MIPSRSLALALLVGAAPLAAAQPAAFQPIAPGQSASGALQATDPGYSHRGPFEVYAFEAREGARYVAELRSSDFDAYLTLARQVRGLTEPLREDDDGAGGTDARLRFRADRSGTHLLVAQALSEGSAGRFTLTLEELPPPEPLVVRPIRIGDRVEAALDEAGPVIELEFGDEVLHHLYRLDGRAGQHLLITMDSDALDAYLEFGPLDGDEIEVTDYDDDGGGGRNARLRVTVPADGAYGIRARAFGEGQAGRYTLQVAEWVPRTAVTRALPMGEEVHAELSHDDAELGHGPYYQAWTFRGEAGQRVRIAMRSDAFDTYLAVGQMSGGVFQEWASNDDAEGTNSIVELALPASGEVVVRATSFGSGITGRYTLLAERL